MHKYVLATVLLSLAFVSGFAFRAATETKVESVEPRVTGVGGIFFKSDDPAKLTQWYHDHLGLNTNPYGASFDWYEGADSTKKAQTQWTLFPRSSAYFAPSKKEFMINYRVADLGWLVPQLRKEGVTIVDTLESFDYGKFIHILDPEGNKIQLWEP